MSETPEEMDDTYLTEDGYLTDAPQQSDPILERLIRMEEKIDTIGRGSNWLMLQVTEAQKLFSALAQNPMIRQMMPKGMTRG